MNNLSLSLQVRWECASSISSIDLSQSQALFWFEVLTILVEQGWTITIGSQQGTGDDASIEEA